MPSSYRLAPSAHSQRANGSSRSGPGCAKADPVLAQLIAERPDFDPDVWIRRLPPMDLFGALIGQLTEVKGIGPWTVQGALLIALHRPDVVRPDDLAVRHAVQVRYGLDRLPAPAEVAELAERWRPYRSLASSLLLAAANST
jgi:hypothetical protein